VTRCRKQTGDGFFGWLGRQLGHVKKAVQTKVETEAEKQAQGDPENQVVYRNDRVEKCRIPESPDLKTAAYRDR